MAPITVPATKVLQTLREVVAERPEYEYKAPADMLSYEDSSMCFYVHGDQPGCLVGHVLNRVGVPLSVLAQREGVGAYSVVPQVLNLTGEPDDVATVQDVLTEVQYAQDQGATWGEALEEATRKPGE
jgi:hypothetical protein